MQRKIYLEGEIGEKFGTEFTMNVDSFGEVMSCLELNFSDFRQYLIDCHDRGIGFICSVAGNYLQSEEELLLQYRKKGDMTIQAIPVGSKGGFGKILLAVALVALTIATAGFTMAPSMATLSSGVGSIMAGGGLGVLTGTTMAMIATGLAINLAIAGLQELMAPDPSVDIQQDESYLFQGSSQTILEGDPVPVLYGELRIPGRPISFEIKNAEKQFVDYAQPSTEYVVPGNGGGSDGGGGGDTPGQPVPDTTKDHSQDQGFSAEP